MEQIKGFIQTLITKYNENVEARNDACDSYIIQINKALQEYSNLFMDSLSYVEPNMEEEWNKQNYQLLRYIEANDAKKLKKAKNYHELIEKKTTLLQCASVMKKQIALHNNRVAELKIQKGYEFIGEVEGRRLDKQQMMCIVKEVHNHLVIAGAGTGKTTTVVGKIKYLLKSGKYKPEDMLVLSFTNASASEMSERIYKETGYNIEASTFHKLGINIITKVEGVVPKITAVNLRNFIREQVMLNMRSNTYLMLLSSYLLYNRVTAKSEFEFKTKAEYTEYLRINPPTTINNEVVKSYGEMDIANFLTQKGIKYIYEHPYIVDTRTEEYGQYKPDFYLPEYDIYIEYFGINRAGEVPPYFNGTNGMTASQAYQASMKWKRETHRNNNTLMVECFAYEKFEGDLLERLKQKLLDNGVNITPKTSQELWEQVAASGDSILDGLFELFQTLINLIKSNGYEISTVREMNCGNSNIMANNTILSLFEPIYNAYCYYLKEKQEIDFNDMINQATKYVEQQKYINPYKYVIVDEYQDISKSRFGLLNSMRKSNDYELFCVGDDWQSIYRFAGSDIGFILNFEKYWGASEISKIETTYRFSQKLIEISGSFIMRNSAQIKKSIKGQPDMNGFPLGEVSGYTDKFAIDFMTKKLDDLPENSKVFLIGRYSSDVKMLEENRLLSYHYNNVSGLVDVEYCRRLDLKMSFITAHKSKGLQADYVFIINNKNARMGFPSKIQDAPILNLLLDNCDQYPYAEERRLFYVALTRAKKKVFIVTINGKESEFAMELKARYFEDIKKERFTCPKCGGSLLKRTGAYGEFWGCSNYRTIGCKYTRDIRQREDKNNVLY